MPASDGLDNFAWLSSPCEGLRLGVVFDDEAIGSGLQVDDRYEDAAFQSPLRELGEEALDGVKRGCRCRREVEGPAGMSGQPLAHLRMFVGCVVVDDGMDFLSRRHLRLDGIEESDELLMAMMLHIASDDGAVENVGRLDFDADGTLIDGIGP